MSAVLCLLACLCVSAAASRGQAPHGNASLIQQAPSGTRQNPTMVESSPIPMSGSRRFPSLVDESPSLRAYCHPPSGSRLNPMIIEESPTQIEEDECDRWFPLALE